MRLALGGVRACSCVSPACACPCLPPHLPSVPFDKISRNPHHAAMCNLCTPPWHRPCCLVTPPRHRPCCLVTPPRHRPCCLVTHTPLIPTTLNPQPWYFDQYCGSHGLVVFMVRGTYGAVNGAKYVLHHYSHGIVCCYMLLYNRCVWVSVCPSQGLKPLCMPSPLALLRTLRLHLAEAARLHAALICARWSCSTGSGTGN